MTLKHQDNFFFHQSEPLQGTLLALREIILSMDKNINSAWKYGMPFFCYNDKMFCYLCISKKTGQPYLGIVEGNKLEHPLLIQEKRSRMKIMLFDVNKDLPVKTIKSILKQALRFYK